MQFEAVATTGLYTEMSEKYEQINLTNPRKYRW